MTDQPPLSAPERLDGGPGPVGVPAAAWALAWSCLTGQILLLADRGAQSSDAVPLSMLAGAVLVAWVSFGVLTGRTCRLVVVWVLFVVALVVEGVELLDAGPTGVGGWPLVHFAVSATQLASLAWFTGTDYLAWQRTRPGVAGPPLGSLVAVAVLVGLLGGVIDSHGALVQVQMNL